MMSEIITHGYTTETDLQYDHVGHEFKNQSLGAKCHKPVKRAGQIICVQRRKIDTQSYVPGV